MFRGLRAQISLLILLITLSAVALIGLLAGRMINREFRGYIVRRERIRSENIVGDLGAWYGARGWDETFLHTIGMYSLYDGYILKVYDVDGTAVWDAENHDTALCRQIMDEVADRMSAMDSGGFVPHGYDIVHDGQKVGSAVIIYYGPYFFGENDFQFVNALNAALVVGGAISGAFSIALGGLLARRIARPIAKTAFAARQISNGDYNIRFDSSTNTKEIDDLANAVNHLANTLGEQEELRKRLTTDVAHELRTPLTAVGSHLEAMIEGLWDVTPERLCSCHEEVIRLGDLVADLEQLAKIEGGGLRLNKSRIDLTTVVLNLARNMKAEAGKKNLSLDVEGPPVFVFADEGRMRQVITNILANAIKYTPEGGRIRAVVGENGGNAVARITDDGAGIAESELPFIFQRFYRTDKSRDRKTGGAGIGLTIAKSIADAHGGTITVESSVDGGSQFTVSIPKI